MGTISEEFVDLVRSSRSRCLWFTDPDHLPTDREAQLELLRLIQRYGTREDYVRARRLRQWLSQRSSATFSVS